MAQKNISTLSRGEYQKLEDVVGCKWSVSVLQAVAEGVVRPGALERNIAGISTKVLSERLRKLERYGLLMKKAYAELPPRTEYSLTPDGRKLVRIIAQIHELDATMKEKE
jgi:DNA-binding HxlR family transcriptional regulator